MNTKWYISTFIILLALIGLNQEQAKVANQQIVLQFTDAEMISVKAYDDALATVTKKLELLGIADIEIIEGDVSQLTIRYYSNVEALDVSEFLSQDVDKLPVDFPEDKLPETCSIVVSDLHQQTEGLGLNGKFAFELKQDYKRFSNPVVFQFDNATVLEQDAIVKVAYRINNVIVVAIENTSNAIPEVRAGPFAHGSS